MLKHNRKDGFTIIEVSIAIALIMGGMIVAVAAINSRLRQENFYKGARAFVAIIDDILNDVSTNNWPHVSDWACELKSDGNVGFRNDPGHETGDGECLYVGKVIQFGDEKTFAEEDNTYIVHTIMTHRNALIPTYNFDAIARPNTPSQRRLHPLGVVEGPPGPPSSFSTRKTKSWPNGMHISQVYYLKDSTDDTSKVYLRGIAVVQQSSHGLKENDLLLTVSGEGQVGIRVVHDIDKASRAMVQASPRLNGDGFANSLKRTPMVSHPNTPATSAIENDFNTPIYICLSDGRGNEVLATLGGSSGSMLAETEFDGTKIRKRCR